MSTKEVARIRSHIIPAAHGRVLEVGIGAGFNLPFYSRAVQELRGVDPSSELLRTADKLAKSAPFPVGLILGSAEKIPLESESFDTVVMTWCLCSIPDPGTALGEILRVLKPGGDLVFAEHGLAPEPKVRAWQNRLNSAWRVFAGGCNLNRPIDRLIASAGFNVVQLSTTYLTGPKILMFNYQGSARKK